MIINFARFCFALFCRNILLFSSFYYFNYFGGPLVFSFDPSTFLSVPVFAFSSTMIGTFFSFIMSFLSVGLVGNVLAGVLTAVFVVSVGLVAPPKREMEPELFPDEGGEMDCADGMGLWEREKGMEAGRGWEREN